MSKMSWSLLVLYLSICVSIAFASNKQSAPPQKATGLIFEVNRGQTAPQARYLARSPEGTLFFSDTGLTVAVPGAGSFRLLFENGRTPAVITPEEQLASYSNYVGREHNVSRVNNYAAVRYKSAFPGTDVRFYGRRGHLEHDFLLAPGADPSKIVLRIEGADQIHVNSKGDLEFKLGKVDLSESVPVAWQLVRGKRLPVQAKWRVMAGNRLGLSLGSYDHRRPVTVDPVLAYATHFGGSTEKDQTEDQPPNTGLASSGISSLGLDGAGNVYVTGTTSAIDFPTTAYALDRDEPPLVPLGGHTAESVTKAGFISKFDPTGKTLLFSTYMDSGASLAAVDAAGQVYFVGNTIDYDPPHPTVNKLSADGSQILYSFDLGAGPLCAAADGDATSVTGIIADDSGHVWVAGNTENLCFATTAGAFQTTPPNQFQSGFIAGFNTSKAGNASIIYSTYFGGDPAGSISGLTMDTTGSVYVVGSVEGAGSFPQTVSFGTGNSAAFVSKLKPDGSGIVFSTLLRGGNGAAVALDKSLNVYIAGTANSSGFPSTIGFPNGTCAGSSSDNSCASFVAKLNPSGYTLLYSTLIGAAGPTALRVDSNGSAFIAGSSAPSPDFPVTSDALLNTTGFSFLTALDPYGQSLRFSTRLGGGFTWTNSMVLDKAGNPWIAGQTPDWNFPVTADAFQPSMHGARDGFLLKIDMGTTGTTDTTPPTVSITSPADGSTVSGTIVVSADASDNIGVLGVKAEMKDQLRTFDSNEVSQRPYSMSFDTTRLMNGTHPLTVMARDAAGNVGTQTISVTVTNPFDFSLGSSPQSASITAGGTAEYTVFANVKAGNPGPVSFSCSGLPQGAQCGFSSNPLTVDFQGGNAGMSISTTAPASAHSVVSSGPFPASTPSLPTGQVVAGLLLAGAVILPAVIFPATVRRRRLSFALTVLSAALILLGGCSGIRSDSSQTTSTQNPSATGASIGTPKGTYVINVTGTAGPVTRTVNVQLIVN